MIKQVLLSITVPEIIPDKTANTTNTNYGDDVTYSVIVTNDGDVDAKDVIIVDQLGNDLKYVSSSDGGVWDEKTNTVTWIIDLSKGETKTFTVVATVVGYGNVTNSLTVGNKTSKINVTVPEITPDKTVDNENPNFGDNVTYTIVVSNDGIADAKNVVVKDVLAEGLKFIEANYNGVYDEATRTVTWIVDINAKNHVDLTVKVKVEDYGVLNNNVTIGNKTSFVNITVPEIIPDKTASIDNPNFGDEITYTVNVTNAGKVNANNVVVHDVLGEGLELISADGGVYDDKTRTITWTVNLNSGETKSFKVVAKVIGYGNVTNSLVVGNKTSAVDVNVPEIIPSKDANNKAPNFGDSIDYTITVNNIGKADAKNVVVVDHLAKGLKYISSSDNGVYDAATHTVTWVIDIAADSSFDLTVTAVAEAYGVLTNIVSVGDKSASVDVNVPEIIPDKTADIENPNFGDNVTYTVTVTNGGNADAKAVVVHDVLGKGLKFVSATGEYTFDESTNTVTWIVDVAAGKTETFNVVATVIKYGNVTNSLVVGNKTFSKNVTVPEITPDKTVDNENPNFGDTVTYTVTVKNEGDGNAADVVIVDTLGKGLEYISSTGNYDNKTNTITWKVNLASGETKTFTVVAKIVGYTDVTNEVTVGNKTAIVNVDIPEIIPTKDVNNTTPNFGDTVEYTVTVNNNANTAAKQVVIVDTLGKGLKFINASHNGKYDEVTRTITWIVDLDAGESVVFSVNATVEAYGNINNTVVVGNKSFTKNITVPEITPIKKVEITNPNFGEEITYFVSVFNSAVVDAKNVVVVDHLDKGLKYVSSSNNGVYDAATHTVTWIVDIDADSSLDLTVTAVAEAYGVLTNIVSVGDKSASADVSVPEITPDKTVNITNPNFGDKVDYTIKVTNDGIGDANNIVVKDVLGEGLKFVSATGEYTWDEDSRTIIWIVDLAKGESKIFHVIAVAEAYGVLSNNVFVGDKSASADVTVPEIIPDKTVSIANPNFGDNVTYTVTVSNDGIGDANNVVIVDRLGEGLTFVSASDNGVWDPVKRTVTWIVDLAKGESKVFTVNATVDAYGNVTNSLVVGNKTTGVNVTVPEINPDKTVNVANPNFGDDVTYSVTVTNVGIGDAKAVVVKDTLSKGLKFISATGNYTFDEATNTITWIVDLAKGESKTFYVNAIVNAYGNVTNSLVVGNKTTGVNVTVPEINPNKTVSIENPNFGDDVTYTVSVSNVGIGDAKGVVVRDVLGEGLVFVSASDGGVYDENTRTVTWIVDLAKGESKVFTVNATVSGYGNVSNSLIVGNKTAGVNVTVPEINPNKTANIENPNFGDNVTYTVTVTNDGIGDANNVVVKDTLGKGLKFISATGNYTFDEATNTITWIVDLAKGESKTFKVNATVSGYGNVTNTVIVGNKTFNKNVTVPEINSNKTVNNEIPNFGDNVTYSVTVTNDGIGDANNVVVCDILGKGLKFLNADGNFTYDEKTGTITWIVDLVKGETKTFNVNVTVLSYGDLSNKVVVGNKTVIKNITVPEINPGKEINIEVPNFGDNVTYTVIVNNTGKVNATDVVVADKLGEGLVFVSASDGGVYNETTRTITWIINLTAGETKYLYVNTTVSAYGNITNSVIVGNKTFNKNVTVPEIIPVKEVNSSDIHIGDEINYTIAVSNPGKTNATNIVIKDVLPEGLKFINASNGGVYDPATGIITWIVNITANSTVDLTVVANVTKSGNITNTVNVGNKTANCTIESKDIADLEIHIVADKSEIYIGDSVVCTVTVINNGPSDAINTIANVFVPNTLSIISYNATKGTFDITSGKWYVGNLTNGEKVVLTFVAKALNEGNSTVYVNVTSETFEVILENNYDNVTVKVLKKAAPIGPDKPVHPDDSSSADDGSSSDAGSESVSLPNTGNPLAILLLCILSVIFAGSRKRKI